MSNSVPVSLIVATVAVGVFAFGVAANAPVPPRSAPISVAAVSVPAKCNPSENDLRRFYDAAAIRSYDERGRVQIAAELAQAARRVCVDQHGKAARSLPPELERLAR